MLAFSVLKYIPSIGAPDSVLLKCTPSGNYTTAEGGDTANLNPKTFTDPLCVGVLGEPLNQPATPPSIKEQALGGYYAQLIPGATLGANAIAFYESEGNELGSGGYPAAITGGTLTVELPLR
jgi:hypothetical protein